jgi:LPXTG-site transpeptidase (sortase) family protein
MCRHEEVPRRSIVVFTGNLLIVAGLALGLASLTTLMSRAPAAGWFEKAPAELATLIGEQPAAGELSLPDDGDQGDSEALAALPASAPAPPVPSPLVVSHDHTVQPSVIPSDPVPSTAVTEAAAAPESPAAPTAPAPDLAAGRRPFLPITRVLIPRLRLETDVAPAKLIERDGGLMWDVPSFRAGHAEGTAGAGGLGNAVLFGHLTSRSAGSVFRDLGRVRVGDRVQVFSETEAFDYRVVEVRTTPRTDLSVLRPMRMASLSLITCAGTWLPLLRDYTQRLVVRAELTGHVSDPPAPSPSQLRSTLPTPAATAAGAQSTPAESAGLTTVFEERFADNSRKWPNNAEATAWLEDSGYVMFAREPSRFVAVGAPIGRPLRDVVVTGAFRKVGGPPGGGYGLIVRDQKPEHRDGVDQGGRYYVLEVGDRGELGIWRREEDHWEDLLPWSPSEVVRPGAAPNELTVRAVGPRLTFVVNGVQVASLEDPALSAGGVGVFVGGDFNQARLERLVVQSSP